MANPKEEFQNMVVLAGIVRTLKIQGEGNAFFLLDVTGTKDGNTKWIPCTTYKQIELADRLDNYREGDPIKIRGFVRAWSQKKDDKWQNAIDVRVTEIKGPDPKPRQEARQPSRSREPGDDDIPF